LTTRVRRSFPGRWCASAALALAAAAPLAAQDPDAQYVLGKDSQLEVAHPEGRGRVTEYLWKKSRIYPGYEHRWWLYIPAQYDGKTALAVMVFPDGGAFLDRSGAFRVPIVFDNLIEKKALPVLAAVLIDPGLEDPEADAASPRAPADKSNRSVEYDTLSADYATFVLQEILPQVRTHVLITDNPSGRGIGGFSSGGICAFTVAWQRPDQFRRVFSANGSFVNIRGGGAYPQIVLQTARKPIRVFQQDGRNDLVHGLWGGWFEQNQRLAAALEEKGYEHRFVAGEGTHSAAHAGSIFPDAMRWLWRDYPR
jgi:enterochelin esterase-like enzyme